MSTPDPYQALGIKNSASQDDIKNAYRKLAKKFHPDLNPGNKQAEAKFKDINAAYERIGEASARAKFDRGETDEQARPDPRAQGQGPYYSHTQGGGSEGRGRYSQSFQGMDEDLFESIFGGTRARGFQSEPVAQDETYQMSIDFKDSILGAEKEISLPSGKRLRVKIPAGIENGKKLRFAGQGSSVPPGNVYVEIQVKPSPLFTRNGMNIEMELPISISEALLGAEVKIPTLDGEIQIKVPSLISSGQKLRVAGKGVLNQGDQYVRVKIVSPGAKTGALDEEFKLAVEAWGKRHPFHPRAESEKERSS